MLSVPFRHPAPGATWRPDLGVHIHVGRSLPSTLEQFRSRPYTLERFLENDLNKSSPPEGTDPQAPPMQPYPVQLAGARAIARHCAAGAPQFLLADDTGVGKTLTCVIGAKAAAKLRHGTRVLVVADRPAAITIPAWARTISGAGDGGLTWCVITWDRLSKVKHLTWDIIVADEAQALRHTTTKRWKAWTVLSGMSRAKNHPYLLLATATPGHSPLELPYLAPAFAHATSEPLKQWTGDGWVRRLTEHGLAITKGRYGPTWTDDPAQRNEDLSTCFGWLHAGPAPATVHREAPWGPVPLSGLPVRLDPDQRAQYEQEWGEFRRQMRLAKRGKDTAKGRAAVLRFRQKAGLVRVPQTAEWVVAQVAAGKQVAVSVQYVETAADPLVAALHDLGVKTARIYGQGRFDVEEERLAFQTGQAPAVVFTPAAAINLQAAEQLPSGGAATSAPRVGVFHQARYSGIQARQVCGRTHRDYQVSPWSILYAEDTVEAAVAKVMVERFAAAADLVGADTRALSEIAALLGADWMPSKTLDDDLGKVA